MRQQSGFSQNQFAHGLEIVESRVVSESAQSFTHGGEWELGFVAQAEERLGAAQFFPSPGYLQNFFRGHGLRARLARVAAENAIPAIVAAQIGEREEHFAGIADYRRFEPVFYFDG